MTSAEKSAQTLKNFPSSSPEVTTKNTDSQISPQLSGVSASTSPDQEGVPCPGGEAGRSQRTRPGEIPQDPGASRLRKLRSAFRGLLLAAGGRRQRLRFECECSRSVAPSSAARDLPPGTSEREGQGSFASSRREWTQGGGGERERREGEGRSGAGEPGRPPPREESERAAGAGGAAAARRRRRQQPEPAGGGAGACSWVAARGAARQWRAALDYAGPGAGLKPLGSTAGLKLGGGASAPRTLCPKRPHSELQTKAPPTPTSPGQTHSRTRSPLPPRVFQRLWQRSAPPGSPHPPT